MVYLLYESPKISNGKISNGHRYLKHKSSKFKTWWRCDLYKYGCPGWGFEKEGLFYLTRKHNHNSEPVLRDLERECIIDKIEKRINIK